MSLSLGSGAVRSALAVIRSTNPVHSVLWLVFVFFQVAGLRLLLQVEFRALLFVVVYVGAMAVLFLFVVRRLNVGSGARALGESTGAIPRAVGRRGCFVFGLGWFLSADLAPAPARVGLSNAGVLTWVELRDGFTGLDVLGQLLYTHYALYFLRAGFILLVARVGAMVLTLQIPGTRAVPVMRQQLHQQLSRDADQAMFRVRG